MDARVSGPGSRMDASDRPTNYEPGTSSEPEPSAAPRRSRPSLRTTRAVADEETAAIAARAAALPSDEVAIFTPPGGTAAFVSGLREMRPSGEFLPYDSAELDAAAQDTSVMAWHALTRSAAHVYRAWERSGSDDGVHAPADVHAPLASLCTAVRLAADGGVPELHDLSPAAPARALLDALRRAFLDQAALLDEHLTAGHVVHVLRSFEQVQRALEADAAHRFSTRLGGLGGLELVVEVAHDMRSPLTSILFLADRLRKAQSGAVNTIQERQLGLVYSAAFGLSSLASDVIELARGGDRLVDRKAVPFSVSDIMHGVRDIVLPIAEEKGLEVMVELPSGDSRVGYPAALHRVLLNLTTNALKFTATGSVVVAAVSSPRGRVEFSVRDTGRGIPPTVMATLFDSFRRRERAGEFAFSSAGLGLSICQKLVAAMGGTLRVETAPEQGTRFSFALDLPGVS